MGAWQAALSGIAGAGKDVATGRIASRDELLKAQDTYNKWQMDIGNLAARNKESDIQAKGQERQFELGKEQNRLTGISHEYYRQQLIQNGYKDLGAQEVLDAAGNKTGKWERRFQNLNPSLLKPGEQATVTIPLSGPPPDTMEGSMEFYKKLTGMKGADGQPIFDSQDAATIAFKAPQLYRQGPAEMYKSFYGLKQWMDQQTGNKFTPAGGMKFAKDLVDLYLGRGAYFHYGPGGTGQPGEGLTANEKREFDARTITQKIQLQSLQQQANAVQKSIADGTTLDVASAQSNLTRLTEQIGPIVQAMQRIADEILARRQKGGPASLGGTLPQAAKDALKAQMGTILTFRNGQSWVWRPGASEPTRVK